jgi:osmotically-inducible protein OsmY
MMRYQFGTTVSTDDSADVGKIDRLMVEPPTGRLQGFVVRSGLLAQRDVVIPVGLVRQDAPGHAAGTIRLAITAADVNRLLAFQESADTPPPGQVGRDAVAPGAAPASRAPRRDAKRPHRELPDTAEYRLEVTHPVSAFINTGTPLRASDGGTLGTVDALVADPATGTVFEVIGKRGLLDGREVRIPARYIAAVTDGGVHLALDSERARAFIPSSRSALPDPGVAAALELSRRGHTAQKNDEELKGDVRDELAYDPAVAVKNLGIHVVDGRVTLVGIADTYDAAWEAPHAAWRVRGVRAVTSHIAVDPAALGVHNDTAIALAIARAFDLDAAVPRERIDVQVLNGHVTLTGQVQRHRQAAAAAEGARQIAGVRSVANAIAVASPPPSAGEIRESLARAFARGAQLGDARIAIAVEGGHVTLSGTVQSVFERDLAEAVARRADGVTAVDNDLVVGE